MNHKRYIEVYKLMEYANNQKDKKIDANDIARFHFSDVVERKKGKWEYSDDMYETKVCSECGFNTNDYVDYNFCPYCGADMRG